jgi:hypothetical protein cdiviTM7_02345
MRIVVVYKDVSDHGREVREYVDDFKRQTGLKIEVMDPDSGRNDFFLRAYDIVEYPTILAIADDGRLLQIWRGRPLPLIDEVAYYAR